MPTKPQSHIEGRGPPPEGPAICIETLYLEIAQALSRAAQTADATQQQQAVAANAATVMAVSTLFSLDTAEIGVSFTEILKKAAP